jgi:hypothetical protein
MRQHYRRINEKSTIQKEYCDHFISVIPADGYKLIQGQAVHTASLKNACRLKAAMLHKAAHK